VLLSAKELFLHKYFHEVTEFLVYLIIYLQFTIWYKSWKVDQVQWLVPVNPLTQKEEMSRILDGGQSGQNTNEKLSQEKSQT
jgi:hypothetical protein